MTSNIRVSIWALSRALAAEKAMRCGIRLLENLVSDERSKMARCRATESKVNERHECAFY